MTRGEAEPVIRIAVVGHTNAGKTSLLRTLTRRVDFGEVSDRPGTTRHVEAVDLRIDGRAAVRFMDTPGLEDAIALREHLAAFDEGNPTPPERIRRFLQSPEAHGVFEQEAKVLRALLEVDAAFLVLDVREAPLPKFRAEIELLGACAKPVLPVLNFVRDPASREPAWRELLSAFGLHVLVRFDAAAPFVGAERELYRDLSTLLRDRRATLDAVAESLQREAAERRRAAGERIAELMVDAAAIRRTASATEFALQSARERLVGNLRREVSELAQRCATDLLALYAFREGDADESPLDGVEGRWSMDFFHPEALKDAGLLLGKGVAVGAAVGVAADLAVAGLSLGAGAALGGAIGGAVSQGWGPLGRKLLNKLRDQHELSVEDRVLAVMLAWQLRLVRALESRGHAATERIASAANAPDRANSAAPRAITAIVRAAQPARSHPDWESGRRQRWREIPARRALVARVAAEVRPAIDRPPDDD
ncbi:Small GTP-binding protein domain-containing protein [Burkholderiales bacterium 8X]|nr:Small GTP-binding protein domain-containing protein [Burkholderiales bacterium 8X]